MALQQEMEQQGNFLFRYRGVLPILILLLGFLMYLQHVKELKDKGEVIDNQSYFFFCLFITLFGFAIRIFTVGYSALNTSGRNTDKQLADDLNTTGLYSVIRHPLYIGNFFMWFGFSLLSQNLWFNLAFVFIYWLYYERIMFAEEQFLSEKFGNLFQAWATKTPALMPKFSNYKRPLSGFKIRKVISKEKTGFLLVGILYFIFRETGSSVLHGKVMVNYNFWFYLMISSVVLYLILKITQKKE